MKHTKAPWVITEVNPNTIKIAHGFSPVCSITHPHWDDEAKANAELIAAAPELLEALKNIIQHHRDNDSGEGELFGQDYITTAIQAVLKAQGGKYD